MMTRKSELNLWKTTFFKRLESLTFGSLLIKDEIGREFIFGAGSPEIRLVVSQSKFYRKVVIGGSLGAGESYMDGDWHTDNLVDLVRLFIRNFESLDRIDGVSTILIAFLNKVAHLAKRNNKLGSKRNISDHYDLSNEFFEIFLDSRMMYSSAVYENKNQTLDEASLSKMDRLCRKLQLSPEDHLLEIGSGWGGFAVYAAKAFGCKVTTTTISEAQYQAAKSLVIQSDLVDKVEVLKCDYRDLIGSYDKLVSIEMVEAVGHQYLPKYFEMMSRLVKPNGLVVIQAITIEDQRYRQALRSVDFIKKHIFPGSFIPCISELVSVSAKKTDTVLISLEDIGIDYAQTLCAWREKLVENRKQVLALGFNESFMRKWIFYLAYCEGGFRERRISDVQLVFAKPAYRGRTWRKDLTVAKGLEESEG